MHPLKKELEEELISNGFYFKNDKGLIASFPGPYGPEPMLSRGEETIVLIETPHCLWVRRFANARDRRQRNFNDYNFLW